MSLRKRLYHLHNCAGSTRETSRYGGKNVDWDVNHHHRQTKRFHFICLRAYPGSEFVVANTLAKWKKVGAKRN